MLGVVLVVLNLLVALAAPAIARWDPQALDVKSRLSPPSARTGSAPTTWAATPGAA